MSAKVYTFRSHAQRVEEFSRAVDRVFECVIDLTCFAYLPQVASALSTLSGLHDQMADEYAQMLISTPSKRGRK